MINGSFILNYIHGDGVLVRDYSQLTQRWFLGIPFYSKITDDMKANYHNCLDLIGNIFD